MTKLNFYKITHSFGKDKDSVFLKSEIPLNDLIEILGCIDFKFEELVDETLLMDERSLLSILEIFFGVERIPLLDEKILRMYTQRGEIESKLTTIFNIHNEDFKVIQIDRFWARESCCGPRHSDLMDKWIPESKEFKTMIKNSTIA